MSVFYLQSSFITVLQRKCPINLTYPVSSLSELPQIGYKPKDIYLYNKQMLVGPKNVSSMLCYGARVCGSALNLQTT